MVADNKAMAGVRQAVAAMYARDFKAYGDWIAENYRFEDRRSGLTNSHGRAEELLQARAIADLSEAHQIEVLETRGDHVALYRGTSRGGDFEVILLTIIVMDDEGRAVRAVIFDEDAVDAARAELDAIAGP